MKNLIGILLKYWLLVALLSSQSLWAQSPINLSGRILDDESKPLPHANVRLLRPDGELYRGSSTDLSGRYRLGSVSAGNYTLEVSFVGFVTHRQTLHLTTQRPHHQLPDLRLKQDAEHLKEVTVVGKASEVVVKGDTIEYNASSYTTSQGAALEELIKKLPGAEINEKGEIVINGKNVSKIMVDGKRFFERDPKVALKNLPAELVDKIQVLDRESDAARMTGFADGDEETVINLTVKKGHKQGLFGTAYAGGSLDAHRYELNTTLNKFGQGKQWTIIAGMNNTNNAGFSDIVSESAQGLMPSRGRRGNPLAGDDGVTSSKILGANTAYTLGRTAEIGAGASAGNSDRLRTSTYERTDILSTGSTTERGQTTLREDKDNFGANLRLEWKPSERTMLIIAPQLSYGRGQSSLIEQAKTTRGLERLNTNDLRQETNSKILDTRLHLDLSHRLNSRGRTVALSLVGRYMQDDGSGLYYNRLDNHLQAKQTILDQRLLNDRSNITYRTRLSYVEPLGRGYAIQLQYQLRVEQSRSNREAWDREVTSGGYTQYNPEYSNVFRSDFLSHRIGLAIKRSGQAYDITAGLNLDPSHLKSYTKSGSEERPISRHTLNFSPTLRLRYKPSKAFDLHLDYRGRSFQPTVNQLAPIRDKTNQLVIYEGNPNLKPGYTHNLFGRLSSFAAERQSSLSLFAHLQYVQSDIVSHTSYDPRSGIRRIGYTNVEGNMRASVGGFYTMPLPGKRFSIRLGTHNMLANQVGFIDSERNDALSLRLGETLTLAYRHGGLDTSLKGTWAYYRVFNSLDKAPEQTTQDYRIDWDTQARLPWGFALEGQIAYRTSSGYTSGYDRDEARVNIGLSYSFLKNDAATIRLKAYDLLGKQNDIQRSISALSSTTVETNTLGRYVMLHVIYRFNRFSGNASAADMKRPERRGGHPHAML